MQAIDAAIDRILDFMSQIKPDSDNYGTAARNLKELCDAREKFTKGDQNMKEEPKSKIDPQVVEILAIVVPSLTAIIQVAGILGYEQVHVLVTKALGFVIKGRIR